ncbi:hypothetical protein P7C73_g4887, partial [Tremellales sp. Uapishka_1]
MSYRQPLSPPRPAGRYPPPSGGYGASRYRHRDPSPPPRSRSRSPPWVKDPVSRRDDPYGRQTAYEDQEPGQISSDDRGKSRYPYDPGPSSRPRPYSPRKNSVSSRPVSPVNSNASLRARAPVGPAIELFTSIMHKALVQYSAHALARQSQYHISTFSLASPLAISEAERRAAEAETRLREVMVDLQEAVTEMMSRLVARPGVTQGDVSVLQLDGLRERITYLEQMGKAQTLGIRPTTLEIPPEPPLTAPPAPPSSSPAGSKRVQPEAKPVEDNQAGSSTSVEKQFKVKDLLFDIVGRLKDVEQMKSSFEDRFDEMENTVYSLQDFPAEVAKETDSWAMLENMRDPEGKLRGVESSRMEIDGEERLDKGKGKGKAKEVVPDGLMMEMRSQIEELKREVQELKNAKEKSEDSMLRTIRESYSAEFSKMAREEIRKLAAAVRVNRANVPTTPDIVSPGVIRSNLPDVSTQPTARRQTPPITQPPSVIQTTLMEQPSTSDQSSSVYQARPFAQAADYSLPQQSRPGVSRQASGPLAANPIPQKIPPPPFALSGGRDAAVTQQEQQMDERYRQMLQQHLDNRQTSEIPPITLHPQSRQSNGDNPQRTDQWRPGGGNDGSDSASRTGNDSVERHNVNRLGLRLAAAFIVAPLSWLGHRDDAEVKLRLTV